MAEGAVQRTALIICALVYEILLERAFTQEITSAYAYSLVNYEKEEVNHASQYVYDPRLNAL